MSSDVAQEAFSFDKFRALMHRHIDDAQRLADRNAGAYACHLFAEHDKREFDRVFDELRDAAEPPPASAEPGAALVALAERIAGWVPYPDASYTRDQKPLAQAIRSAIREAQEALAAHRAKPAGAAADVLREREKQRAKWGDAHDDDHDDGTIAVIAAAVAVAGTDAVVRDNLDRVDNLGWDSWDLLRKHQGRRDQLVIAAALLIAEIERLDRLQPPPAVEPAARAGGEEKA